MKKLTTHPTIRIILFIFMLTASDIYSQWSQTSLGWDFLTAGFANSNDVYMAGWTKGIYHSSDIGESWVLKSIPGISTIGAIEVSGKTIFVGAVTPAGKIFKSNDNGNSWSFLYEAPWYSPIWSMASSGRYIFAGTISGLYRSTNSGSSWALVPETAGHDILGLVANGSNIYEASFSTPGMMISSDFGETWRTTLNDKYVIHMAVRGEYIFAGTEEDGLYISSDKGMTWTQSSLLVPFITTVAVKGKNIYVSNFDWNIFESSMYRSTDNGETWNTFNDGFTFNDAFIYPILFSGDKVIVGTDAYSAWSRSFVEQPVNIPFVRNNNKNSGQLTAPINPVLKKYSEAINDRKNKKEELNQYKTDKNIKLYSNYPNPFNPSTVISYELPNSSYVNVTIYNSIGQSVATLVNDIRNAGRHSVEWNASAMPSGIYYYRLEAGAFTETKKMMLVK